MFRLGTLYSRSIGSMWSVTFLANFSSLLPSDHDQLASLPVHEAFADQAAIDCQSRRCVFSTLAEEHLRLDHIGDIPSRHSSSAATSELPAATFLAALSSGYRFAASTHAALRSCDDFGDLWRIFIWGAVLRLLKKLEFAPTVSAQSWKLAPFSALSSRRLLSSDQLNGPCLAVIRPNAPRADE